MVALDIMKKINPICISKKLGLYIKNPDNTYLYGYVKDLIEDTYYANLKVDRNFRRKMI